MRERISIATPDAVDLEFELAGAASRFIAYIIDSIFIILGLIGLALTFFLLLGGASVIMPLYAEWGPSVAVALLLVVWFVLNWGYFVFFEARGKGQTPGKKFQGIRVVRDNGVPISWKESALRNLVRIADMLPPPACLVGGAAVIWSASGKRLGDMLAGTIVVREDFGTRTSTRSGAHWEAAWLAKIESGKSRQAVTLPHGSLDAAQVDLLQQFLIRRETWTPGQRETLAWKIGEPLLPLVGEDPAVVRHSPDRAAVCEAVISRIVDLARLGGNAESAFAREAAEKKRHQWIAFEDTVGTLSRRKSQLRSLSADNLAMLIEDYGRLISDLARARSMGNDAPISLNLNRIAVKAHALLYGYTKPSGEGRTGSWLLWVPAAARSRLKAVAFSAALLFGPAVISYCAVQWYPALAFDIVPDVFLDFQPARTDSMHEIPSLIRPVAATSIITNNIGVTFMAFAFGLTAGIGTAYLLISNGVMLGGIAGWMTAQGQGRSLWGFIMPHGGLELLAIVLAGGAGFALAGALAAPGEQRRSTALARAASDALLLVVGSVVLLLVAGMIEGFVSPSSVGFAVRVAVFAVTLSCALLYLTLPNLTPKSHPSGFESVVRRRS